MDDRDLLRYSRQILLPELDIEGQRRIQAGRVAVIGCGGLGSPVALYLVAAGLGEIVLVDGDRVDLSNLQRQILFRESDLDRLKVESAAEALHQMQSRIHTHCIPRFWTPQTDLPEVDVLVDCSDNFKTRRELNEFCRLRRIPLVSGAAIRWEGQLLVSDFSQSDTPCMSCYWPETTDGEDEGCNERGILGAITGVIGSLQALETLKFLAGLPTRSGFLIFDGLRGDFRHFDVRRNPHCRNCAA